MNPKIDQRIEVLEIFAHPWVKKMSFISEVTYSNRETVETIVNKDTKEDAKIVNKENLNTENKTVNTNDITIPIKDNTNYDLNKNDALFDSVIMQIQNKKGSKNKKTKNLLYDMEEINQSITKTEQKIILKVENTDKNKIGAPRLSSIKCARFEEIGNQNVSILKDIIDMNKQIDDTTKAIDNLHADTVKVRQNISKENLFLNCKKTESGQLINGAFGSDDFYVETNTSIVLPYVECDNENIEKKLKHNFIKMSSGDVTEKYNVNEDSCIFGKAVVKKKSRNIINKKYNNKTSSSTDIKDDVYLSGRIKSSKFENLPKHNTDIIKTNKDIKEEEEETNEEIIKYNQEEIEEAEKLQERNKKKGFFSNMFSIFKCS